MNDKQASQINITLGTAGHIDHGKTALIRLLTGCETDRLKQEKERGMSIELGFAPCRLGDLEVGIVDVPGHENFIKTMVAGASGIDGVIFVVAADDSIMPQTREHLNILTLLGVKHGMVALTKTDIVSPERVEQVISELKDYLKDTFLAGADICPMSNITGDGFDFFYDSLKSLIKSIEPKSTEGVFRQPVEKFFSVKGFGNVISGIPVSGSARVGDEVTLLPKGTKSRIKAIQVYGRDDDTVRSGQCAALNLPQLDFNDIERGNVLTKGEYFEPSEWFLCSLKILNLDGLVVKHGKRMKFHTGTSEVTAKIYLLEDTVALAGQEVFVQLLADQPIVAGPNDRFILRSTGPVQTVGGGTVIEPLPKKLKRSRISSIDAIKCWANAVCENRSFIEYCLKDDPWSVLSIRQIALRTKLEPDSVKNILARFVESNTVIQVANEQYLHAQVYNDVLEYIYGKLEVFHKQMPDRLGMERDLLLQQSDLEKTLFDAVVKLAISEGKLLLKNQLFALTSHQEQYDPAQQALLDKVEAVYKDNLFSPPNPDDIRSMVNASQSEYDKTIAILTEQKIIIEVERKVYFHSEAIEEAKRRIIDHVNGEGQGRLESVKMKYLLDTTRKYALPILDYMDKIGVTRRSGNTRFLK